MPMIRVRVKATGQVLDMVPEVAKRMIAGGTAERINLVDSPVESMAVAPEAERAVVPAQAGPRKKTILSRVRSA